MTGDVTLREKDVAVLKALQDDADDLFEVRCKTTLSNREANYAFEKLADAGLIETWRPDGRVTRVVEGQERSFEAPKKARVTESGVAALEEFRDNGGSADRYIDMEREEVVMKVRDLENRIEQIESGLERFRKQVLAKLEQGNE